MSAFIKSSTFACIVINLVMLIISYQVLTYCHILVEPNATKDNLSMARYMYIIKGIALSTFEKKKYATT